MTRGLSHSMPWLFSLTPKSISVWTFSCWWFILCSYGRSAILFGTPHVTGLGNIPFLKIGKPPPPSEINRVIMRVIVCMHSYDVNFLLNHFTNHLCLCFLDLQIIINQRIIAKSVIYHCSWNVFIKVLLQFYFNLSHVTIPPCLSFMA